MDYTVKYANFLQGRFRLTSKTDAAAGHNYNFTGARTVKTYSMIPSALQTYVRGGARFGAVEDLDLRSQEMICTQEKCFTKHIEALDNSDTAVDLTAGKFIRMQIDDVINPHVDKYRLRKWTEGAATLMQMANAPTKNTIGEDIMTLKGQMGDALVPEGGLKLFIATPYYAMLKQTGLIDDVEGYNREVRERGRMQMFDGMKVISVPSSWLGGAYFMIKAEGTSEDPIKLAKYETIEKAVGYSGPVIQGLLYFDAFVIGEKNVGIGVAGPATVVLNAPALTNTSNVVTIDAVAGVSFYYTVDGSDPRWSTTRALYSSGVTLTAGQTFRAIGEKEGCVSMEATENYE